MGEQRITYSKRTVKYSGLFEISEIHKFIRHWFDNHGFDFVEELTDEKILKNEKQIIYDYKPYREFSDFAKTVIAIDVKFLHVKDKVIEVEGIKKKMNTGDISFSVTGLIETDYLNKWETKPFYYFLKSIFEKFVFGSQEDYYETYTNKMCDLFLEEFKSLLNMNRLKV
jgi:hypothetical protein